MIGFPARTLRGRLTILYGILLAFALVFYAAGTSLYQLHGLKKQLDTSLDRDIETVEGLIALSPGGGVELRSKEGEAREDRHERGYLLEVWSVDGKLLYRSAGLDGIPLGAPPQLAGMRLDRSPHSYRVSNGMRVRVANRLHRVDQQFMVVRLALSEEPLIAAAAMSFSAVSVIGNALRLLTTKL